MQIMQTLNLDFWGLIEFLISDKPEMYPEKISFLHFFPTQTLMLLYYKSEQ